MVNNLGIDYPLKLGHCRINYFHMTIITITVLFCPVCRYSLGDVKDPSPDSVALLEEIIHTQVAEIVSCR